MNPYDEDGYQSRSRYGRDAEQPPTGSTPAGPGQAGSGPSGGAGTSAGSGPSVGRASVGRARVPGAEPAPDQAAAPPVSPPPAGPSPYGAASPYGGAYGAAAGSPPMGSAPGGQSPMGQPPAGRAAVRPVSPTGGPGSGGGYGGPPTGPGGYGPRGAAPAPGYGPPGGMGGPGGRPPGPGGPGFGGPPPGAGRAPVPPPGGERRPFSGFGGGSGDLRSGSDGPRTGSGRGPGGGGRGPGGRGPGGKGPGGKGGKGGKGSGDKRGFWRRDNVVKIVVASVSVLIILSGLGFAGGVYFIDGIKNPDQLTFPQTTIFYYDDGTTEMARLGEMTRIPLTYDDLDDSVKQAIVASEDNKFWTNPGIDFNGVLRAAWNNVTGGSQQGASTITQQYARLTFDLEGATYSRKLREAVLAWRLNKSLDKTEILDDYLNAVPFGRHAYGIEAAAQAFFGKTASKSETRFPQLTVSEAMALVLMVKQPEPDEDDPEVSPGYDPARFSEEDCPVCRATALEQAEGRWEYVRGQMVALGYLTQADADQLSYPPIEDFLPYDPDAISGMDQPTGLVVYHALSELTHDPNSPFYGKSWDDIGNGGYRIITTINKPAEDAAIKYSNETLASSPLSGQPDNLQAAMVSVEPGTGRVIAYYGGASGTGADYAGWYYDDKGDAVGFGAHPPGSSFKIYTLAAALNQGISLNSYWEWVPHQQLGRPDDNPMRNASNCAGAVKVPDPNAYDKSGYTYDPPVCSLYQATVASLNVPFYDVTLSVGAGAVLQMARDAGVDSMWSTNGRQDLVNTPIEQLTPGQFDTILGIGQYPITVLDHANGTATFASGGYPATAHFVKQVTVNKDGQWVEAFAEKLNPNPTRILPQASINDLDDVLSHVSHVQIDGWESAGKTGTWECDSDANQNCHVWMIGYTNKLATAVWVGNKKDELPLHDDNGAVLWGSGFPYQIWQKFMTDATTSFNFPSEHTQFDTPTLQGNLTPYLSMPSPSPSPSAAADPTATASAKPSKSATPGPTSSSASPSSTATGTDGGEEEP